VVRETFFVLRETFFVLRETFFVLRETFFVLRETFFVVRETFFVLRETFFVVRETFFVVRETFLVVRETCCANCAGRDARRGSSRSLDPHSRMIERGRAGSSETPSFQRVRAFFRRNFAGHSEGTRRRDIRVPGSEKRRISV
jgi:hypothetical protein